VSEFKFLRCLVSSSECYHRLLEKAWFHIFNHWLNPLGNWHEPLAFPEENAKSAKDSILHPWLWWMIRNPLHNFSHFWIGITPVGKKYEWIKPEENGWRKEGKWWKKKNRIPLFRYNGVVGWQSRGNFRIF